MRFHEKIFKQNFLSNEHKNVLKKNVLLKIYFHLKDNKNYLKNFYTKIHLIYLSKHYMKSKKNCPQNNTKRSPKKVHFFTQNGLFNVLSPFKLKKLPLLDLEFLI